MTGTDDIGRDLSLQNPDDTLVSCDFCGTLIEAEAPTTYVEEGGITWCQDCENRMQRDVDRLTPTQLASWLEENPSRETRQFDRMLEILRSLDTTGQTDDIGRDLTPALGPEQVLEQQIIDEAMVDALAVAMKAKLARACEKGRGGWDTRSVISVTELWDMLMEHAQKDNLDMVDVANFAGMLWMRVQHTSGDAELLREHIRQQQEAHAEREAALERVRGLVPKWSSEAEQMRAGAEYDDWAVGAVDALTGATCELRAALANAPAGRE